MISQFQNNTLLLSPAAPIKANHNISFPLKLHELLDAADMQGFNCIVSWLPDGNSFQVHDQDRFVKEILPKFFRQSKYKSFQRQLNLWGFQRLNKAVRGAYQHNWFVRGKSELCSNMKRVKVKGTGSKRCTSPSGTSKVAAKTTKAYPPKNSSNDELFEESELMEILSCSSDDDQLDGTLREGDSLLFEGRNFFFVEDYHPQPTNQHNRRLSIE